ncbi:helix-turn-helix domain-containing protein [Deinococcus sp.]|uniref:helix-turn-helix domain-containing protein n=1 Tax=Deinococcus sp. TaxID=47478 RepID=UPI003CC5CDB3
MNVNERIRVEIRAAMSRQGVTQAELARRLGVKPPSLAQVLSGKRGVMPESLMDVLHALGLTLDVVPAGQGQED